MSAPTRLRTPIRDSCDKNGLFLQQNFKLMVLHAQEDSGAHIWRAYSLCTYFSKTFGLFEKYSFLVP